MDALFFCTADDYSHADWGGLCDYFRDVPWEDIYKLGTSAATEFRDSFQAGIYIPHWNYQVKSHSSFSWFTAASAASSNKSLLLFVPTGEIYI